MKDLSTNHILYERLSKLYELVFKPFFMPAVRKTLELLEEYEVQKVLEVGSGTGYSFKFYPSTVNLVATDLSEEMVRISKKRAKNSPAKSVKVFNALEVDKLKESGPYDVVVSFSVITVVPDPQKFIEELKSYCKPGGHIFLIMHIRGKGFSGFIDKIGEIFVRVLFGFTLQRRISDYNLKGLELIEKRPMSKFLFYTYNHLVVLQKH